jgi:hypothetical protein
MRCRTVVFASIFALLLLLAACGKAECKKDSDCVKPHFTGSCDDKKCSYAPIPNECGNLECEPGNNENKCTCAEDCGECSGKSGKYLTQQCNAQDECVEDVPETSQKPISLTKELTTGGSKISVTSKFAQPFNLRKDQIELEFGLNVLSPTMRDLKVSRLELTGTTPDKRTVALADKSVEKTLFAEGSKAREWLILEHAAAEKDGELTNLNLKVYIDYTLVSGTTLAPKSVTLNHPYSNLKFAWALPATSPGCPKNCDDGNPGTDDVCGPETNYFCEHRPKAGACGNGVCDANENKCTCPQDCGPCASTGTYLASSCVGTNCVSQLKPGIAVQPQSIFDERELGAFTLQNTYRYNKPFNTKADKLVLELTLYAKKDDVSGIKIKDIRLLESAQEVAFLSANKELTSAGQKETIEIAIPAGLPEQERSLTLRVWYEYTQGGETKQADFSRPLGKMTLISPDV